MHLALLLAIALAQDFHGIRVVDGAGNPHPCAWLETVHHVRYLSDEGGYVAVDEPGLMGERVWFTPESSGMDPSTDWLGIAGFAVDLVPGELTVEVVDRGGPDPACARGDIEQRMLVAGVPTAGEYHEIQVLDDQTGAPVPAVRLDALGQSWWTDNGGRVAWHHLDHMDQVVSFDVSTHGYTFSGTTTDITTTQAGVTVLEVYRDNAAERLVRLTGGGTWRDSGLLGYATPLAEPYLDAQVIGQDSAQSTLWRGSRVTVWGDTLKPSYPLGNFYAAGAFSDLGVPVSDGIDYDYLEDANGFTAEIAPRYAEGPVWLSGLIALDDDELWATFLNISSNWVYLREGMVRWDVPQNRFVEEVWWPFGDEPRPGGPAIRYDGPDGDWVMYRDMERIPADPASMADPTTYQSYTPFEPNGVGGWQLATVDGAPDWQWRNGVPTVPREGVADGLIEREHSPWHNTWEADSDERPTVHNGHIVWNPWRERWIHVFTEEIGDTSWIGEIWYAEGDTPVGPWSWARKIITHDSYSFYNPNFHPDAAEDGGRRVFFEGTYTAWLGTDEPTPRHDYNQVLYGLDLEHPDVESPVPFYDGPQGPISRHDAVVDVAVAFGAYDREHPSTSPVRWSRPACDPDRILERDPASSGEIAFWAPVDTGDPDQAMLVEWTLADGTRTWSIEDLGGLGAVAGPEVATVWAPRWQAPVPLSLYPLPEQADAGLDQCGITGPVTMDGSGSILRDGITSWSWTWDQGTAEGEVVELELEPGLHVLTLTVTGPTAEMRDQVTVTVEALDEELDDEEPEDPSSRGGRDGKAAGCGCVVSPHPVSPWLTLGLLVVVLRRKDRP